MWDNRERLKELQELFENVRIPQDEIYNNYDAYHRMQQEGAGYFVMSYCNEFSFKDKKTRELFRSAKIAMVELKEYLECSKYEDENDLIC